MKMDVEPRRDLPLRLMRPPLRVTRWQRMLSPLARLLWKSKRRAEYDARAQHASALIREVQKCHSRAEIESLLGPPRYALEGTHFSAWGETVHARRVPDRVEVYEHAGCTIDIWYDCSKVIFMTGAAMPDAWDVVSGALDQSIPPRDRE